MKISFDVSDLSTNRADGTTRYTYELAKRLPEMLTDTNWVYHAPADFNIEEKDNIRKAISPWAKYWTQLRLPFDLLKEKPNVLFMPIQQLPILRPSKVKTVAVIHDLAVYKYPEQFTYKDWLLLRVFSAQVARQADEIIAVSQATANDIADYYGRTKNVHVVHHGLDHNQFFVPSEEEKQRAWQDIQKKYSIIRKPYLLYVGQIQPRKNLEKLIEAFEHLKDENLQLVIAGGHGWLNKGIHEKAERSSVADRIIFTGRVDDELLAPLYWHAEAFVLPSLYEGFGMPILEAFAAGCPVVTSNISSMPEIAGDAAVLVDPKNSLTIANGINEVLKNREEYIRRGIERARKFNWNKTAKETLSVLV